MKFRKFWWQLSLGSVLFIFVVLIGANYLGIGLVSAQIDQKISVLIGSTPLIPKTNRQILTTAFYKNSTLRSYEGEGQISLQNQNQDKLLMFNLKGVFEKNNYALEIDGSAGPLGLAEPLKVQTSEKGKELFFRIDSFPSALDPSLRKIYGKSYKIDIGQVEKSLNLTTTSDQQIQKDIRKFWSSLLGVEKQSAFFREFKKGQVKDFYTFELIWDKQKIDQVFGKDMKIKKLDLTLFVEKSSGYLQEVETVMHGVSADEILAFNDSKLTIRAKIGSMNSAKVVSLENARKVESIFALQEEISGKQELAEITQKSVELGGNLLTMERLVHVILLLPSTF